MRLTKLYLHMSLFEQRLVAVGWRVRDDHAVILTLSPKTFIQQYAESGKYHPYFCYEVYWLAKIISLMIGKTGNPHNRRQSMVIYEIVIDSKLSGITVNPLKMDWSKVISAQDVIGGGGGDSAWHWVPWYKICVLAPKTDYRLHLAAQGLFSVVKKGNCKSMHCCSRAWKESFKTTNQFQFLLSACTSLHPSQKATITIHVLWYYSGQCHCQGSLRSFLNVCC